MMPHHEEQIELIALWVNRWQNLRLAGDYKSADTLKRFLEQMGVEVSVGGWWRPRVKVIWRIPLGIGGTWWLQEIQ